MFLRCNTCGEQFTLAKSNGGDGYFIYSNEEHGDDMLSEFLSKHDPCMGYQYHFLVDMKHPFELVYESDDDYEIYNKNY